jgi:hypothetical protein
MPLQLRTFDVVVASPGDVQAERDALSQVVAELNRTVAQERGSVLRLRRWEADATPGFSDAGPQAVVDDALKIETCDVFVGIFWKRLGTPVYDAPSGTIHEFRRAYDAWKRTGRPLILMYFNQVPYYPADTSELTQWAQVLEFKKTFPPEGLWWTYNGVADFERLVRPHLARQIFRLTATDIAAPTRTATSGTGGALPSSKGFRGRAAELERLSQHLLRPEVSLILIEGIAGIGKSSLARQFASRVNELGYIPFWHDCHRETTFDGLVWDLSSWARRAGIYSLADALDDSIKQPAHRLHRVADAIAEEPLVLFLDDYHHVTDSELQDLPALLDARHSRAKTVPIVRRRPAALGKFALVAVVEEHLREGLDRDACIAFLKDAGVPDAESCGAAVWALTGGGHPKALQLIALRSRRIPVRQLLRSLPVFRADVTNQWLMPLLSELDDEEREVLLALSVFDRPIELGSIPRLFSNPSVELAVASLLERFLLDPVFDEGFQMHPLVRDFCVTQLADVPSKHLWAAEFYRTRGGTLSDSDFAEDHQIKDLLAAWSHYVSAGDAPRAAEVVEILRPPLMNRGQYGQVLQLLDGTVPQTALDGDFYTIQRARLVGLRGDVEGAVRMVTPLLDASDERTRREAVLVLTTIYQEGGMSQQALDLLDQHWRRFAGGSQSRQNKRFLSRVLQAQVDLQRFDRAVELARRLSEWCEADGDRITGAIALRQMAVALHAMKQTTGALQFIEFSCALLEGSPRVREVALNNQQLGVIRATAGDVEGATEALERALEAFVALGEPARVSSIREQIQNLTDSRPRPAGQASQNPASLSSPAVKQEAPRTRGSVPPRPPRKR